jgi:protoporphyrinogen oxidase
MDFSTSDKYSGNAATADAPARAQSAVLGGGLAGLSAALALGRAGQRPVVFEAGAEVGGLCRTLTLSHMGQTFRYDIGGHRFFTYDHEVMELVRSLMGAELLDVGRTSKIYMWGKWFDYPLRPANSLFGLGPATVVAVLADYLWHRVRARLRPVDPVSLEDWVVDRFGRRMFDLYFREYSEKVWGIPCARISESWVARRIQGLSLGAAVKHAFFKMAGREIPTFADRFHYPALGIGRLADRFAEEVADADGKIMTSARIERVTHAHGRVTGVFARNGSGTLDCEAGQYISTIPLPALVEALEPAAPAHVLAAARSLGFRDLVIVAAVVERETVTDQSWIYIPESRYRFGRLHEPKVWSRAMAPEGKTLVVVEFFCFAGDETWRMEDEELLGVTERGLAELGFIAEGEVAAARVHRVPGAYPLFEVGYERHCAVIEEYLAGFDNLILAGRGGTFAYQNMDHALASGAAAARAAIAALASVEPERPV